jgi:hypothetical protein
MDTQCIYALGYYTPVYPTDPYFTCFDHSGISMLGVTIFFTWAHGWWSGLRIDSH